MNGCWIPTDMKGRELTAKDYRRLYETAVGYDRRKVDQRLDDLLFEIQSAEAYLLTVTDDQTRRRIQGEINGLHNERHEIMRLLREDQTADIDHAHKAIDDLMQTLAEGFKRDTESVLKMRLTAQKATWLRFRITPCERTTKQGATKYWSQQEIADVMNLTKMQVCRMESRLHRRKDIMDFLKTRHVPDRVKRSVTKRKKSG